MRSGLLCFAVMVGLDLLAIPAWGVLGAAAVSSLAYSVQAGHLLLRHSRSTGLSLSGYLLVRRDDLVLVLARLRSLGSGARA
jgi:hypothetical protein